MILFFTINSLRLLCCSLYTASADVQFSYPPTYPDVEPELEIVSQTGLSSEQVLEIETYLKEQVNETSGCTCNSFFFKLLFNLSSITSIKISNIVYSGF